MARATTDDLREIMGYYRIQAEDLAHAQWQAKLRELHEKRTRGQ